MVVATEAIVSSTPIDLEPIARLTRDIKASVQEVDPQEVRQLISMYYAIQDYRIESAGQIRALKAGEKPIQFLSWLFDNMRRLEDNIKSALDYYTDVEPSGMGAWAKSIYGIGPVLSAALIAYIDIEKAPYAGHIERFGGLDPKQKWLGREGATKLVREMLPAGVSITDAAIVEVAAAARRSPKEMMGRLRRENGTYDRTEITKYLARRPWNNDLKVVFWKIGQSFMKFSGRAECFYGKYYVQCKAEYLERNLSGAYAERAAEILATHKIQDVTTRETLESGQLADGHINAMSRRKAVKLFINHWHMVAHFRRYGTTPPLPYTIAKLGHLGFIDCPYFDQVPGLREALAKREETTVRKGVAGYDL